MTVYRLHAPPSLLLTVYCAHAPYSLPFFCLSTVRAPSLLLTAGNMLFYGHRAYGADLAKIRSTNMPRMFTASQHSQFKRIATGHDPNVWPGDSHFASTNLQAPPPLISINTDNDMFQAHQERAQHQAQQGTAFNAPPNTSFTDNTRTPTPAAPNQPINASEAAMAPTNPHSQSQMIQTPMLVNAWGRQASSGAAAESVVPSPTLDATSTLMPSPVLTMATEAAQILTPATGAAKSLLPATANGSNGPAPAGGSSTMESVIKQGSNTDNECDGAAAGQCPTLAVTPQYRQLAATTQCNTTLTFDSASTPTPGPLESQYAEDLRKYPRNAMMHLLAATAEERQAKRARVESSASGVTRVHSSAPAQCQQSRAEAMAAGSLIYFHFRFTLRPPAFSSLAFHLFLFY